MTNPMPTRYVCGKCTYHHNGQCHRHPPRAIPVPCGDGWLVQTVWPVTADGDWCGDFQKGGL